jgi:putative transcriptional regulator
MSKKPIISVEHNPGDPPIETDTDWDYVDSLTDEQIAAAVADDPDAVPVNFFEKPGFILIVNVFRLRTKLGMTQEEFAALYCIPLGTLRDWEQRRKRPDATARAYLKIIERDPKAVARLLGSAA